MKHTLKVTVLFAVIFVVAQLLGLLFVSISAKEVITEDGITIIAFEETAIGERPQLTGWESVAYIIFGVAIGTLLLLLLAKNKKVNWWKTWFFLASTIAISIALGVLMRPEHFWIAWLIGAFLAYWKIKWPNMYVQNITEVLMYAGLAVIMVPLFDVLSMIIILILFSLYDMYAVWKSKHMVRMAEFTAKSDVFPGITIPYSIKGGKTKLAAMSKPDVHLQGEKKKAKTDGKLGVLGGGDIIFPLLFAGVIMLDTLMNGATRLTAYLTAVIIVVTTTISLIVLFTIGKSDKFYPAMPFITTGCLVGYLIVLLL